MPWDGLPPKKRKQRSGIARAPQRKWMQHRRFVTSHQCCVTGCWGEPVEFCHWSTAANRGAGLKSFDWFGIGLCSSHHALAHQHGHKTFQETTGVDWLAEAAKFVKATPDKAMRAAMGEPGAVLLPEQDMEWMEWISSC